MITNEKYTHPFGWTDHIYKTSNTNRMSEKNKTTTNLPLIIGIVGTIAGIGLLFTETWFIGIFGSIASAGLAYKGFQDMKAQKETEIAEKTEQ